MSAEYQAICGDIEIANSRNHNNNHAHRQHNCDDRPHFNEQQLAERWGISVKKLQADRLKGGGIPFIRIGRAVRYRFADIAAWEERNLYASTTAPATGGDHVK